MSTPKKTLSAKPPFMTKSIDDITKKEQEMSFINEGWITIPSPSHPQAEHAATATVSTENTAVWAPNGAREDVIKTFNLRLSEPTFLKLKYIAQKQRLSVNSICARLIQEFVDSELNQNQYFGRKSSCF